MAQKQPKSVAVLWDDAWYDSGGDSLTPETARKNSPTVMESRGFLLSRTKKGITLATDYSHDTGEYRHEHFIDSRMIISVIELEPKGDNSESHRRRK